MRVSTSCCDISVGLGLHSPSPPLPRRLFHQLNLPTTSISGLKRTTRFDSIYVAASPPLNNGRAFYSVAAAASSNSYSSWDDDTPYEELPFGKRIYLDEQDVVTFLDPPKELIPLDPSSYNPASYLWKKIEDIPEERRHRLLSLLKPRLISRAWEIAGRRYDDAKLAKKSASAMLSDGDLADSPEFWNCQTGGEGGPPLVSWMRTKSFRKALFICKDGKTYGRLIVSGAFLLSKSSPLYFAVNQLNEVMSTEQPCDFAYEFGDGLWDLPDCPQNFPKPARHAWPFNDQVVIYVRHVGPGVMVGQAWQEGEALQQVPRKLWGEILMVKHYIPNPN